MKRYDIEVDGQIQWNLSEAAIVDLHLRGAVYRSTRCRISGEDAWRDVNEFFPLLKYGARLDLGWQKESGHQQAQATGPVFPLFCFIGGLICAGVAFLIYGAINTRPEPLARLERYTPAVEAPVSTNDIVAALPTPTRIERSNFTVESGATVRLKPQSSSPPIAEPAKPRQPVPVKHPPKIDEYTIQLESWNTINTVYGSFRVKVRDHGPVTITVWINGDDPRRIEKVKGFERDGTNIVPIYSLRGAKVYYVDRVAFLSATACSRLFRMREEAC